MREEKRGRETERERRERERMREREAAGRRLNRKVCEQVSYRH